MPSGVVPCSSPPQSSTSSPRASTCVAHSFWAFAIGAALMGVFRALDSGPLEAWFVDTVHATDARRRRRPVPVGGGHGARRLDRRRRAGLRRAGVLEPLPSESALLLPFLVLRRSERRPPGRRPGPAQGAAHPRRRDRRPARARLRQGGADGRPRRARHAAHQQGAARHHPGRGVLGHRDGRLRVLPADPARRDARQRGAGGRADGAGRLGRLGRVRPRRGPGRARPRRGSASRARRSWPGSSTAWARW